MTPKSTDAEGASAVSEYLAGVPEPQRTTLQSLRSTLLRLLPAATEAMSYGMPAVKVDGRTIAGYAARTGYCSYYPHSGDVLADLGADVLDYRQTKGALHFPSDRPLADDLVQKLIAAKLARL